MADGFREKKEFEEYKKSLTDFNQDFKGSLRDALVLIKGLEKGFIDIENKSKWVRLLSELRDKGFNDFKHLGDHLFEAAGATKELEKYYKQLEPMNEAALESIANQKLHSKDILEQLKKTRDLKKEVKAVVEETTDSYEFQKDLGDEIIKKLQSIGDAAKKNVQFGSLLEGSFSNISTQLVQSLKVAKKMDQIIDINPFKAMENSLAIADNILHNLGSTKFDVNGKSLNFKDAVEESKQLMANSKIVKDELMGIRITAIPKALDLEIQFNKEEIIQNLQKIFPEKQSIELELLSEGLLTDKNNLIQSMINSFAGLEKLSTEQKALADIFFKELDNRNSKQIKALMLQEAEIRRENNALELGLLIREEQLKTMNQFKPVFAALEEGAQQIAYGLDSAFGVLPIWLQSVLGVQGATKALANSLNDSLNKSVEVMAAGKGPVEAIGTFISSFSTGLTAALTPLGLMMAAFAAVAAILVLIEGSVRQMSQELGISKRVAKDLYKASLEIQMSYTNQFATQERILEIVKQHKESYGQLIDLSKKSNRDAIEFASGISAAYGVAANQVYAIGQQFQMIGADQSTSENLVAWLATASELSNIPFETITKDLAEASETVAIHFAGYPKQAAKAAVEVRRMGMSLKQAGAIMDKTMDVGAFLTDMTELAAMTGGMADLSSVFEMRFNGESPEKIAKAVVEEFDALPESMQQNEYIARKFAATIGQTVDDLRRGQQIRKLSSTLSEKELATLNAHLGSLSDADLLNAKAAAMKASQLDSTERLGIAFNKIKATLIQALLPHIEALSDTIGALIPVITFIGTLFKIIGSLIKFLAPIAEGFLWPFKMLGKILGWISDQIHEIKISIFGAKKETDGVAEGFNVITAALHAIGGLLAVNFIGKLLTGKKILSAFPGLISKMGGGLKGLFSKMFGDKIPGAEKIQATLAKQGGILGKVFGGNVAEKATESAAEGLTKVEGPISKMGTKLSSIFKNIGTSIKNILKGVVDFIFGIVDKIFETAGKAIENLLGGIGKGLDKFGPSALKGAVALVLIAGALWITSKAIQNFADVGWESVAKALVSLGGLVLMAVILGKIAGQLIVGALAIAILGASLIPTAFALEMFNRVNWSSLGKAGLALLGLAVIVGALGAIMMSGVGAVAILAGAAALALMGAALMPAALAMGMFAKAFKTFEEIDWSKLKEAIPVLAAITLSALGITLAAPGLLIASLAITLFAASLGILGAMVNSTSNLKEKVTDPLLQLQDLSASKFASIGVSLAALSAGLAVLSIGNAFAGFLNIFTGDPIKKLEKLANLASPLASLSASIKSLVNDFVLLFTQIKNLETIDLSKFKEFVKMSSSMNVDSSISISKSISETINSMFSNKTLMDSAKPTNAKNSLNTYSQIDNISNSNSSNSISNTSVGTAGSSATPITSIKNIKEVVKSEITNTDTIPGDTNLDQSKVVRAIDRLIQVMQQYAQRPVVVDIGGPQLRTLHGRLKTFDNH